MKASCPRGRLKLQVQLPATCGQGSTPVSVLGPLGASVGVLSLPSLSAPGCATLGCGEGQVSWKPGPLPALGPALRWAG